ncbi:MAG: resuscitation-promoting factor RpfA [Frankiales bacterium]|nr:resuscitation-promoting factor RpfA [Frankiales bacterium]
MRARCQLIAGLAVCALLALTCPRPAAAARALQTADLGTALAAVCGALALLVAAGLVAGGVLVLLSQTPGALGRLAGAISSRCLPAALRTALVTALAVGGAAGPALAGVAAADTPRPGTSSRLLPDLDRPAPPTRHSTPLVTAEQQLTAEEQVTGTTTPTAGPHPAHREPVAHSVVVRPGDSLWRIAGRSLGPTADVHAIAVAWPQWWAANRAVIGSDPDLIQPGQHLSAPTH